MSDSCTICNSEPAGPDFRVGATCASRLGLRQLPPARRPAVPCTRCNGMQFIRVLPRTFSSFGRYVGQLYQSHSIGMPMTLTAAPPAVDKHLLGKDTVQEPQPFDGLGTVETFICRGCGFVEWYCQDPQSIPIGHEFNSELVDYAGEVPYR